MNNNEFNIQRKEKTFFTTLSFFIPDENLTACISSILEDVIKKYSIPEQSIVDIHFSKTEQKEQKLISVAIKYYNFNPYELKALDKEEQIRFVLNFMGYADEDIESISYEKRDGEIRWKAKVLDPEYDFDPDESECEWGFISSKEDEIREALGFGVDMRFSFKRPRE